MTARWASELLHSRWTSQVALWQALTMGVLRGRVLSGVATLASQVRLLADREITYANGVDRACRWTGDRTLWTLDAPLPWAGLDRLELSALSVREFAARFGNALCAAGLQRRGRVAVYKMNAPDYFFLSLAIVRAGGIAVPINGGMALADLRRYLTSVDARMLVTDVATFASHIADPAALPMVSTWIFPELPAGFPGNGIAMNRVLARSSPVLAPPAMSPDSEVIIAHTSGTTGYPKGVIATVRSLVTSAKAQYTLGPVSAHDRVVVAAPFNHLVCHTGMFSAMLGGIPVHPLTVLDPEAIFQRIDREQITIFFGFPDVYGALHDAELEHRKLDSMRLWFGTADTSHEDHKRAFTQHGAFLRVFGRPLLRSIFVDALGSSEIGFAALSRLSFSFTPVQHRRLIGTPNPAGPRVKVADEHGRELPPGQIGRLMVKGPTLFKGYWNAHDRQQHGALQDGWWWTGDLAHRNRRGQYFHLDRDVDVIRTAEGPVYSLPAEDVLMSHAAVAEAVVFAVPHPVDGPVAVALVVPRRGRTLDRSLLTWVNAQLKLPARIADLRVVTIGDIPRGLTGKILKRVLREREVNWFSAVVDIRGGN